MKRGFDCGKGRRMDDRVLDIYGKFIKHKEYGKALDVLEASYAKTQRERTH